MSDIVNILLLEVGSSVCNNKINQTINILGNLNLANNIEVEAILLNVI